MTENESIIQEVRRISAEPGDLLWVKADHLTMHEVDMLREAFAEHLPGTKVILTNSDVDLALITPAA